MRTVMASLIVILALALQAPLAAYARDDCAVVGRWSDNCTISNSGGQVDLGASTVTPGTGSGSGHGTGVRPNSARPAPKPTLKANPCTTPLCRDSYVVAKASDVYPKVSVADLASFRPQAATAHNEPAGVAIVGMPSNVVAAASTHELQGDLLGFPVSVQFVPESYTFDYGDVDTRTVDTGGATWAALAQPEYTPTHTSHVFRERGAKRVTVWVNYRASVLFDGSYRRDVAGIVRGPAQAVDVRVVAVATALVDKTCAERPRSPGC